MIEFIDFFRFNKIQSNFEIPAFLQQFITCVVFGRPLERNNFYVNACGQVGKKPPVNILSSAKPYFLFYDHISLHFYFQR
jgi:hypothetical protein